MRSTQQVNHGDRVVVVGAGPAGLTLAYVLSKRGFAVTVLEATDAVGGISRTVQYRGYRFDIGGHRFFTKIKPVQELWNEWLGGELLRVPRLSRIYYDDKFFDYPLKPANALRGLGALKTIEIIASYARAKLRPSEVEDTFEQWVTNRFGRKLYEVFFRTYTEKVWGIPCTEIRAEWAAQRIQGLSLWQAMLNASSFQRRDASIKSLIDSMEYPRFGPGQMWEACRDRVVENGGTVLMRHTLRTVELREGKASAVVAETPNGEARFPAEHIVSTTDLRALVSALGSASPVSVHSAAGGLRYRDFVVVSLILRRERIFPDNWIYVHTPGVSVGRIQNFKNWSSAMVPDAGTTCLGMEYFCFEGDGTWTASDDELIKRATRELAMLGFAEEGDVIDASVVRQPKAYPVYDASYREHLNDIRAFIDPIPNLHTIGRNGMHKYNNQDHSMYTALLTVENMLGVAEHDVWAVNSDFDYHEEQRVEAVAGT